MYYCKTPGCIWNKKGYFSHLQGLCQECRQPLILEIEFDELETDVINNYPYIIAYPFKRMIEEQSYFYKFSILKDSFINTLKYLALLVATEYFRSSYKSVEINAFFRERLSRPYYGNWNQFLEMCIEFLESNNHLFFVKELPIAYHKLQTGKQHNTIKQYTIKKEYTDAFGTTKTYRIKVHNNKPTAINVLLAYRNDELGHSPTMSEQNYKELYFYCYPILRDIITAISFCKNYPMLKADRQFFWKLTGTEVEKGGSLAEVLKHDSNVWLQNSKGHRLPLLPFFVQPYTIKAAEKSEILMYEGTTGARIIFHSPEGSKEETNDPILLNQLHAFLEEKLKDRILTEQEFNYENLKTKIICINEQTRKELENERKILPGIYQRRNEAEMLLRSWIKSSAPLFFLHSEAGTGKTNLLAEINRQYKDELGYDTLFLRASRFEKSKISEELKHKLNLSSSFDFKKSVFQKYNRQQPFILIIDGGNEHDNPELLLSSIKALINEFPPDALKILLSWRITSPEDFPDLDQSWNCILFTNQIDSTEATRHNKYGYKLQRLNKIELAAAWDNYNNHPEGKKKYRPKFSLNEVLYADRITGDLLSNPLLLRLFLELFNNKTLESTNPGFINIWKNWWKITIEKDKETKAFITRLAVLMIKKKSTKITLDKLYDDPIIGASIRTYVKDAPYQKLLFNAVLSQYTLYNRFYVSFVMEDYFFYSLTNYLIEQEAGFETIVKKYEENEVWGEAIKYYLHYLITNNSTELLIETLQSEKLKPAVTSPALVYALETNEVPVFLKNAFHYDKKSDWVVINKAISIIEHGQNFQLKHLVVRELINHVNTNIWESCAFLAKNLDVLTLTDATKQVVLLEQLHSRDIYDEQNGILVTNLAEHYRKIANYDKALQYYEKGLELHLKYHGENEPEIAVLYNNIGLLWDGIGDYKKALSFYKKALNIQLGKYGSQHPAIAASYNNIGTIMTKIGKLNEALRYHHKSLEVNHSYYGADHPSLTIDYNNIAFVLEEKEDFNQALELHYKSLTIKQKYYRDDHSTIAISYNNIGGVLFKLKEYDKALEFFQKSLLIKQKAHETEQPDFVTTYNNIGLILSYKKDYSEAIEYFMKCLKIKQKYFSHDHEELATIYDNIGSILTKIKEYDKALDFHHKSELIYKNTFGEKHLSVAINYSNIAFAWKMKGDKTKAIFFLEKALLVLENCGMDNSKFVKDFLKGIESLRT